MGSKAHRVIKGCKASKALGVQRVRLDRSAHKVSGALRALKVLPGKLDHPDLQVNRARWVLKDHRDPKEMLARPMFNPRWKVTPHPLQLYRHRRCHPKPREPVICRSRWGQPS